MPPLFFHAQKKVQKSESNSLGTLYRPSVSHEQVG